MSKYGSMRRPASKISTRKQIASVQRSFVRGVLILLRIEEELGSDAKLANHFVLGHVK